MTVSPRPRRRRLAVLFVVLFLLVGFALRYGPYLIDALDARARAHQLVTQVASLDPGSVDREHIAAMRRDVETLGGDLAAVGALMQHDPLVVGLSQLPGLDQPARDALNLIGAGGALVGSAEGALNLGDRFVDVRAQSEGDGKSVISGLIELMATSDSQVDQIGQLLQTARASAAGVSSAVGTLHGEAATITAALDKYQPLVDQYRALDQTLPTILGMHGTKRYLVLAQDPAELRPTGGYIGTVGTMAFTNGSITEQQFQDVYQIDLLPGAPFVEPPDPLANHLIGDASWQLADANWSPDFPSSAQQALQLYTQETGDAQVDGVVGLTTYALDRILAVTGPLEVPDYGVTVASGDVTLVALAQTRGVSTPNSDRKAFLDALARTAVEHLYALPASHWSDLFQAFDEVSRQRMLLVWFKDPAAEQVVAKSPIGGALRADPGDYLYVVEANMAPTSKYNLAVKRSDTLDVSLDASGNASSQLTLAWQNNAATPGEPYESLRSYSTSTSGLYGAYVRAYVPGPSELVAASGAAIDPISRAESVDEEDGRAVFGNYLLMQPGASTLTYTWTTPSVATSADGVWHYHLTAQRQPGLRATPVTINLTLPAGAQVVSTAPEATVQGERLSYSATVGGDITLDVAYTLP